MKGKGAEWKETDITRLFYECTPFNGYAMRAEEPKYGGALERYLAYRRMLEGQMNDSQIRQLNFCIEALQLCTAFEARHYFREGFLMGRSARRKAQTGGKPLHEQ